MARDDRLHESYTATLAQLTAKEGNGLVLGMKMLMWMLCLYWGRWLLVSISVMSRGGDRISGSKLGKHSRVKDTLIILSRSRHGRRVFIYYTVWLLVVQLALPKHLRGAPTLPIPVFTPVSRIRASRNEE